MQKSIDEISSIVLERLKNPYIITFLISWILFNWRPIIFFIFSKGTAEYKLNTIQIRYSDVEHYFCYPMTSTLLFLFVLPYLNTLNEYCLQWTLKKRRKFLTNQIKNRIVNDEAVLIADFNKDEAIRMVKEGKSRDEYISKLETSNSEVLQEVEKLRNSSVEENTKHNEEMKLISDKFSDEMKQQRKNYQELQKTNSNLSIEVFEKQKEIDSYKENSERIVARWRDENKTLHINIEELNIGIESLKKSRNELVAQLDITHAELVRYQDKYGNL